MTSHLSPADRADFNRALELYRQLDIVLDRIEHLLGDDDPMTYSRDDDEPLAALLPPGIEGVAYTGRPRGHNSSPSGSATDTRRAASSVSGPVGAKQPEVVLGDAFGMGAAPLGGGAALALRGGALR